jgi:hypothetical protein
MRDLTEETTKNAVILNGAAGEVKDLTEEAAKNNENHCHLE